ncbi:hypothetical protein NC652_017267 [Populus alba x Populus x berolinensis]|nr:hypothetical protein NC652_017267 [Populus alba x Populus x berolinensis]
MNRCDLQKCNQECSKEPLGVGVCRNGQLFLHILLQATSIVMHSHTAGVCIQART